MNISNLNKLNEEVQSAPSFKLFLLYLCDFVAAVKFDPQLLNAIEERRINDSKELKTYEDQLNKELQDTLTQVDQYCRENGITRRLSLENLFDPAWITFELEVPKKYMFLEFELRWLLEVDPTSIIFVSKFAKVSCDIDYQARAPYYEFKNEYQKNESIVSYCIISKAILIVELKLKPVYAEWYSLKERFEVKTVDAPWRAWDNLVFLYELKNDVRDMRDNFIKSGKYLDADITAAAFQQFKKILHGHDEDARDIGGLQKEGLKRNIKEVSNFLQIPIENLSSGLSDCKDSLSYDQENGILTFAQKFIKIYGQNLEGKCLSLFFPNGKPIKDKFHYEVIYTDMNDHLSQDELEVIHSSTKSTQVRKAVERINIKFTTSFGENLNQNEEDDFSLIQVEEGYFFLNSKFL